MKYIIDSNCFIQAHRMSYPLDVATSFWTKFKELAESGRMFSLDKVKEEICRGTGEDDLKSWCEENLPDSFFLEMTSETLDEYRKICGWAQSNTQYTQAAKTVFMDQNRADAFLVAFAAANVENWTVVTQEVSAPLSKNNIKLPDACKVKNVCSINIMDMFRELEETF